MKKILLFLLLPLMAFSQEEDWNLIPPVDAGPVLTAEQANMLRLGRVFNNWGITRLGFEGVTDTLSGKGVKVCVCDTGRPTHTKLQGIIKGAENFTSDPSVDDAHFHATHVIGIIQDFAPDVEIYAAKVLSDRGFGSNPQIAKGILWCRDQGVDIISMSLGGRSPSDVIEGAINAALAEGITVIAAAGNNGQSEENNISYPGKYETVVCVGSINNQIKVSKFSSSGEEGDVVAPGEDVLSHWGKDGYRILSGTSMATPYVAALHALYIEAFGKRKALERLLEVTSRDIVPEGFDRYSFWGHPTTNLFLRDTTDIPPPPPPPPVKKPFPWGWVIFGIVIGIFIITAVLIVVNKKKKNEKKEGTVSEDVQRINGGEESEER